MFINTFFREIPFIYNVVELKLLEDWANNAYLYLLCLILFVLCFLYCFVYVHLLLLVLSALVKELLSPSDNSIAVIIIVKVKVK